jgi:hypothetical protein
MRILMHVSSMHHVVAVASKLPRGPVQDSTSLLRSLLDSMLMAVIFGPMNSVMSLVLLGPFRRYRAIWTKSSPASERDVEQS